MGETDLTDFFGFPRLPPSCSSPGEGEESGCRLYGFKEAKGQKKKGYRAGF